MAKLKSNGALVTALKAESAALGELIAADDIEIKKRTELRAQRVAEKTEIDAMILRRTGKSSNRTHGRGFPKPITEGAPEDSPYAGLSMSAAGAKYLESVRQPRTVRDIWAGLTLLGFTSTAASPMNRLQWELRKRQTKPGDVILVGRGQFAAKSLYTAEQVKEILATRGEQPGRDHDLHVERTKAGMENRRASGFVIGAPKKMTEDTIADARKLLLDGKTAPAVAAKIGVSVQTIYQYFKVTRANGEIIVRRKDKAEETEQQSGGLFH